MLGPLSVLGALGGGLLGPAGIAGYTLVLSLPAWIVYAVCRLRRTWPDLRRRLARSFRMRNLKDGEG